MENYAPLSGNELASSLGNTPIVSIGQSVIPLVNRLQDIFSQFGSASTIDLPQVAVIGSQSSGKSSVLEALVGRDFLPRGSDICTRRPLVLQLIQLIRKPDDKSDIVEWGEFLHTSGKRYTDFSLIRNEIEVETERDVGSNKGISDKQIRLKVFSPHVLNLTLVDLPGITKVPVGDQPSDIESRVRSMILSYIKHETCIILAVSPANADLANSDALQMARMADPDGSRTIGVITKLDIMDRGTDARNFLLGSIIPLRLGYIGVVNRSQEDIIQNKSIRDALVYEENFFRSHPVYHSLADRCGVPQLARKLNRILVQHIKSILPDIKAHINTQMVIFSKELSSYGEHVDSKSGQAALLLNIITRYSQGFSSIIDGKSEEMPSSELSGGARLHFIFQNLFVKSLDDVDPCDHLTDEDIKTAIQNATGAKNTIFVPEVPFEVLVRRQIARLLDPSLQCARFVYNELVKVSHQCESYELQKFPILRKRVEEVVANFLRDGLIPAETMICHLIEMEMDYINTSHPSFIGGSKAVELVLQQHRISRQSAMAKDTNELKDPLSERISLPVASEKMSKTRAILGRATTSDHGNKSSSARTDSSVVGHSGGNWGISSIFTGGEVLVHSNGKDGTPVKHFSESVSSLPSSFATIQLKEPPVTLRASDAWSEQDSVEIAITRLLIKSYYDIVRKNIQDLVPKAIMHFLVNQTKRELHNVFIRKLYRENLFEEMLQEREEVAVRRKRCKEVLHILQQAAHTLEELPLDHENFPAQPANTVDETGLPLPLSNGYVLESQIPNAAYANMVKSSKVRKSFFAEELLLSNSLLEGSGIAYSSIYS